MWIWKEPDCGFITKNEPIRPIIKQNILYKPNVSFKKIKASKVINKGAIIMIAVVSAKVKYLSAEKKPIVPQKRAIDLKSWIFKNFVFEISHIVGKN